MTETTTKEQIEDWETELTLAMANQQWRRALQLCSWLRYALEQQDRSDPEVEQMHRRAKEALAEQMAQKRAEQTRQREYERLRLTAIHQSDSGTWAQALDAIEVFHQHGASQQEALGLLQEFKRRLSHRLHPAYRQIDPKTATMAQRFNELVAQVRGDS